MTYSDGIATVALLASLAALGSQGLSAYRRRRRLNVRASVRSDAVIHRDGQTWLSNSLQLTAQALGGPVGISALSFEVFPPSTSVGWMQQTEVVPGWPIPNPVDLHSSHRALEEGESVIWVYRISTGLVHGSEGFDEPRLVTAVFTLATGKEIRTEPVVMMPDYLRGDEEEHIAAFSAFLSAHGSRTLSRRQRMREQLRRRRL